MQEIPLEEDNDLEKVPGLIPECVVISDSDDDCRCKSSYLCPSNEKQNSSPLTSTNHAMAFEVEKGFSSLTARSPVNPLKRNCNQALLEDYDMFHNYKCSSQPVIRSPLKANSPSPRKRFQRGKFKFSPQKFQPAQVPNQTSIKSFVREFSEQSIIFTKPVEVITIVDDDRLPCPENVSDKLSATKSVQHLTIPGKNDYSRSASFYESSHSSKENMPKMLNISQRMSHNQFNGVLTKTVGSQWSPQNSKSNLSIIFDPEHDFKQLTMKCNPFSSHLQETFSRKSEMANTSQIYTVPGIHPTDESERLSSLTSTDECNAAVLTNAHTISNKETKECTDKVVKKHVRNLFRDVKSKEAIRGPTDCSSSRSIAVSSTESISNYSIESYNKVMDTVDSILADLDVESKSTVLPDAKISEMKVARVHQSFHYPKQEHKQRTLNWKLKREIDFFSFQKPKTEQLIRLRDDLVELPDLENGSSDANLSAESKPNVKSGKSSRNFIYLPNSSSVIRRLKTESNGIKAVIGSNVANYKIKCEGNSPIKCKRNITSSTDESKYSVGDNKIGFAKLGKRPAANFYCDRINVQKSESSFIKLEESVARGFKCLKSESISSTTSGSEKYHKIKLNINVPSVKYQRWAEPLPKQYIPYLKIMKIWFDESDKDGSSVANGLQGLQEFTTYTAYPPIEFVPVILQLLRQNQNSQLAYETLLHFLRFNGVSKEVDWWKEIVECMNCLNARKEPPSETDCRNNLLLLNYVVRVLSADIEDLSVMPDCFTLNHTLAHNHLLGGASETSRVIALAEWLALSSGKKNALAMSLSVVDILNDFLTLAIMVSSSPLTTAASAGKSLYGHYKNMDQDGRCKLLDCLRDHLVRYKTLQPFVIEDLEFRVQSALLAYPVTIWTLMDPAQYVDATRNLDEVAHVMKFVVLDYASCWTEQLHLPVHKRNRQDLPDEEREILRNVDDKLCVLQNHLACLYSVDWNSPTWQQLLWQLRFLG